MSAPDKPPRKRAQAIAQGRGQGERLVIPLAFDAAASISARPLEEFRHDPTQLANGLLEWHRTIGADGICVALADGFERASAADGELALDAPCAEGTRVAASLEACRRLRATLGDAAALLAGLTGPATLARQFGVDEATAGTAFTALVKRYCEAGCDLVLVCEEIAACDAMAWTAALKTAANIARFHRAHALLLGAAGPLPAPVQVAFGDAAPEAVGAADAGGASFVAGHPSKDCGTLTKDCGTPTARNPARNPAPSTGTGVIVTAAVVPPG
ncbi:MAG: hypothetical protein AB7I32_12570, partial [Gammaproteobacteria bacterium]